VVRARQKSLRIVNRINTNVRGDLSLFLAHIVTFMEVSVAHMPVLALATLPVAIDVPEVMDGLAGRETRQRAQAAANRASTVGLLLPLIDRRRIGIAAVFGEHLRAMLAALRLLDNPMARHRRVHLSYRCLMRSRIELARSARLGDKEARVGHILSELGRDTRVGVLLLITLVEFDRGFTSLLRAHIVVNVEARAGANLCISDVRYRTRLLIGGEMRAGKLYLVFIGVRLAEGFFLVGALSLFMRHIILRRDFAALSIFVRFRLEVENAATRPSRRNVPCCTGASHS